VREPEQVGGVDDAGSIDMLELKLE